MKKSFLISAFSTVLVACNAFIPDDEPGTMAISFCHDAYSATKSSVELPDTNSFILSVIDSDGIPVYQGKYGSSPEKFELAPGNYTVTALSTEFKAPKFSSPQFGDRQVVVVKAGASCSVELICRQMNSGVKLNVSNDFLTAYPKGSLFLKNTDGKLMYSYSEKRIAYFNPGKVSLMLSNGAKDDILTSRILESQEILVLNVSVSNSSTSSGGAIGIQIDTTRFWYSEDYVIGEGSEEGGTKESAMGVAQARSSVGKSGVWICGYIVGGDLSSSSASFSAPFTARTNIAIASRSSVSDKTSCLSVQLQKGKIRDALNLVDNPDNIGKEVFLKGDIVESYYGIPGIQNITEYSFK